MSTRKKRVLGMGIAVAALIGLLFVYQSLAAGWQVDKVRRLAAEAQKLPRDQSNEARSKLWAEAKKLSPEQRRDLFMEGSRARLKKFFGLPPAEKTAYLDSIIKRDLARQAARKKQATAKGSSASKNQTSSKGAQANGQGQRQGQGPGGQGRSNRSPEQRAAQRRDRLDRTNPNDRAMRGEFASAMHERRKQLGLPSGSGRGRWR